MNIQTEIRQVITSGTQQDDHVLLEWQDGSHDRVNLHWLRDNCPTAGDRNSAIRSFSLVDMPEDLAVRSTALLLDGRFELIWEPDGHSSCFDPQWLAENLPGRRKATKVRIWSAPLQRELPWHGFADLDDGTIGHLSLLDSINEQGFAMVRRVPDGEDATEALLNKVGFIQENDFGRIFNIISEPEIWELSQSDLALDVHTDDPYRHTPPGISLLHCVAASPEGGGVSLLTDGFAVAEHFRDQDPEGFQLLSSIAVGFIRYREDPVPQGDDVHLFTEAPIISVDGNGSVIGIRYHERSMAPLDMSQEVMSRYYPALIAFTRLINAREFQIQHALQPGEAIMFDNQRVLHGRTAFDGKAGRRHMRLTQTSRDQFHSKLRLLRSRHGKSGAADRMPGGARF